MPASQTPTVQLPVVLYNAPPPPIVSHRVSVLLIISRIRLIRSIQHYPLSKNRQLRPFDPDCSLEDGCCADSFRRTLVNDLPL
jgi:hypothetical protein